MNGALKQLKPMKYLLLSLFLTFTVASAIAKPQKVYMSMEYTSYINENSLIQLSTKARVDGKFQALPNLTIELYMLTAEGDSLLTNLITDANGEAQLLIAEDFKFVLNEKGFFNLRAVFPGNKEYKKAKKKLKAKGLKLKAEFVEKEGNKNILIQASDINSQEEGVELPEINIEIAVKRLFADLKIGSLKLVNGTAEYIFDESLPGIDDGELELLIKVVDNRTYKNVVFSQKVKWGQKISVEDPTQKKSEGIGYLVFMILSLIAVSIVGILYHKQKTKKIEL